MRNLPTIRLTSEGVLALPPPFTSLQRVAYALASVDLEFISDLKEPSRKSLFKPGVAITHYKIEFIKQVFPMLRKPDGFPPDIELELFI